MQMMNRMVRCALATLLVLAVAPAGAQSPHQLSDSAVRYMAMGDSIAAGFKAQPATQGYAFLLYRNGVFAPLPRTLFNDIAAVGATSLDVLTHQVPLATIPAARGGFRPQYLTLTVGGNDLAAIHRFSTTHTPQETLVFAAATIFAYGQNLSMILAQLATDLPTSKVFVGNQYTVPEIAALLPGGAQVIADFNTATATVVSGFPNAHLVDVFSAFQGRTGLLLIERRGASPLEVHLTNAGHRAMADAFADVIAANK
jgi:lysophospholipase L1-like esterase